MVFVMGVFKLPITKEWASVMATSAFVIFSLLGLFYRGERAMVIRGVSLQFLVLAVLPILYLRLRSWGQGDFNDYSLMGIKAREWHRWSRISFILIVLVGLGVWRKSLSIKEKKP